MEMLELWLHLWGRDRSGSMSLLPKGLQFSWRHMLYTRMRWARKHRSQAGRH